MFLAIVRSRRLACKSNPAVQILRLCTLRTTVDTHLDRLSTHCEEFKTAGLPANEASRIRQYVTLSVAAFMSE